MADTGRWVALAVAALGAVLFSCPNGRAERTGSVWIERRRVMARWSFEPGHTAAEFCARHMMVTCVRGHFKNVHGALEFDPDNPKASSLRVEIDARGTLDGGAGP